ncbi:sigma factor-like helix-turn-helix DNA-binding protein [Streptomyces justiciae]|uniref:sigma factor-like helix-turn-helix DNA-binding protein n=1 Tax=Streptomyces justiciae TaxID=2780140 RepID=UPI0018813C7C|nr:sigma factor-like helix-turn-helix DNA-binding protein [Streptomyces justiciae]MBE8478428.1 RNA polymerase subunit sigma-24 [Streptomyces justiciae]
MSRIEEFEEARPLLYALARRMLGNADQAEAAVHQAWLRYDTCGQQPPPAREFLTAAVARICTDMLRSRRPPHPPYTSPRPPEPLPSDAHPDLPRPREPVETLTAAALRLLERLSPLERAAFVLRDLFGCDTEEIASAMGCTEAACHQLVAAVPRAHDGGGKTPPWPQRITGAEQVSRVLAAIMPALVHIGVTMQPQQVGHRPGAVFRDRNGRVLSTLTLDIHDGRIHTIRWVTDPYQQPAPT